MFSLKNHVAPIEVGVVLLRMLAWLYSVGAVIRYGSWIVFVVERSQAYV